MSPPSVDWRIRGGENFKSAARVATDPTRARAEWEALRAAIERQGGEIVVAPAPAVEPQLTGLIYTANAGQAVGGRFYLSRMKVLHRRAEAAVLEAEFRKLGYSVEQAPCVWEGQADVCLLDSARVILTYGVRSDAASADWVRRTLFPDREALVLRLREPYFHGDVALSWVEGLLFACREAFVALDERALCDFAGDVVWVPDPEARAYALNSLPVGGSIIVPRGARTDFGIADQIELDLSEVCGKGGGGPRCLVNRL